jgi:hypothetical protein
MNATLIIVNSRRTSIEINNFIKKINQKNLIFFDYLDDLLLLPL